MLIYRATRTVHSQTAGLIQSVGDWAISGGFLLLSQSDASVQVVETVCVLWDNLVWDLRIDEVILDHRSARSTSVVLIQSDRHELSRAMDTYQCASHL